MSRAKGYAVTTTTNPKSGVNVHKVQVPDPANPGKYLTFRWSGARAPADRFAVAAKMNLTDALAEERFRRDADREWSKGPKVPTLSAYAVDWLDRKRSEAVVGNLRFAASSYDRNREFVRSWVDSHLIGRTPLDRITESLTREWARWLAESPHKGKGEGFLKPITREQYIQMAAGYLRQARRENIIHTDPFSWFRGVKVAPTADERDRKASLKAVVDAEQFEEMMAFASTEQDRAMFQLLFHSGLRIGEAVALHRRNIRHLDAQRSVISVEGSWNTKTKRLGPVKTPKGFREVPVARFVVEDVLALTPGGDESTPLFDRGRHFTGQIRRTIQQYVAAGGTEISGTHGLRRSHATQMRRMGMMPEALRARLGHEDIRTTLDFYVNPDETDQWAYLTLDKPQRVAPPCACGCGHTHDAGTP